MTAEHRVVAGAHKNVVAVCVTQLEDGAATTLQVLSACKTAENVTHHWRIPGIHVFLHSSIAMHHTLAQRVALVGWHDASAAVHCPAEQPASMRA